MIILLIIKLTLKLKYNNALIYHEVHISRNARIINFVQRDLPICMMKSVIIGCLHYDLILQSNDLAAMM